jgi:hypothetical protein
MHFVLEYWSEQRSRRQTVKDIPEGRWTHLEAYMEKATDASGRVTVWQDGVLLFDVKDVKTANSADLSWSVNNYAEHLVPSEATILVDDAAISTSRIGPGNAPRKYKIYLPFSSVSEKDALPHVLWRRHIFHNNRALSSLVGIV